MSKASLRVQLRARATRRKDSVMRYRILRRALMMSVAGATVVALAACSGGSGGGGGVAATAGVGTPASGGTVQPTSDPLVFWDLP